VLKKKEMESTNVTVPVVVPATLPVIDISPLTANSSSTSPDAEAAALQHGVDELREACLRFGFFYIKNHGIDENLIARLFAEGKRFFGECPHDKKESIHMRNNAVFRGWFELQGEYTSKKKDFKVCFALLLVSQATYVSSTVTTFFFWASSRAGGTLLWCRARR
jgi:isopenicillin N synthase-like dioxygenase